MICYSVEHIQLKLASNHFSCTQKFKTFPVEHATKPPKGRIWAHPALEPPVLLTPTLLFITHSDSVWHRWRMMDSFGVAEKVFHVSFPGYRVFNYVHLLDLCNLLLLLLFLSSISDHAFSICAIIMSRACHVIQSATCFLWEKVCSHMIDCTGWFTKWSG